jgi:hypothetical protein
MNTTDYILIIGFIALFVFACIFGKNKKPVEYREFKNPEDDRFKS